MESNTPIDEKMELSPGQPTIQLDGDTQQSKVSPPSSQDQETLAVSPTSPSSPTSSRSLWYLPEILGMVRAYTDLCSFAALCQTSKAIYHFGHCILYESIHLRLHKQHPESLILLWRTLEKNESLTNHVKSLRLQFCDPTDPYESVSEHGRGVRREQYVSQSSMIPKIIDVCCNLRTISITHPYTMPKLVEQGIHKSLSNLRQLRELDLIISDTDWPPNVPGEKHDINASLIPCALSIESLDTFSLTLQQGPDSLLPKISAALHASGSITAANNITSLSLHRARFSMDSFVDIMRALPHLKRLSLSLAWHTIEGKSGVSALLDCGKIGEALSHRSSTLESLKITVSYEAYTSQDVGAGGSSPWAYWGLRGRIGDLRSFRKLSSLELDPEVLLGWEDQDAPPLSKLLPNSLRHFKLRWDFGAWDYSPWAESIDLVCQVVDDYLSSSPQLESLLVTCFEDELPLSTPESPFTSLKAKCEADMIRFQLKTIED